MRSRITASEWASVEWSRRQDSFAKRYIALLAAGFVLSSLAGWHQIQSRVAASDAEAIPVEHARP